MNMNKNAIFTNNFFCSFGLQEEIKEAILPMHKKETEKETVLEEVKCITFSLRFYRLFAYFRLCNVEKMATKALSDQKKNKYFCGFEGNTFNMVAIFCRFLR